MKLKCLFPRSVRQRLYRQADGLERMAWNIEMLDQAAPAQVRQLRRLAARIRSLAGANSPGVSKQPQRERSRGQ